MKRLCLILIFACEISVCNNLKNDWRHYEYDSLYFQNDNTLKSSDENKASPFLLSLGSTILPITLGVLSIKDKGRGVGITIINSTLLWVVHCLVQQLDIILKEIKHAG